VKRRQVLFTALLSLVGLGLGSNAGAQGRVERPGSLVAKSNPDKPSGKAVTNASLLLLYEYDDVLHERHDAWFVDTTGRLFGYSSSDREDVLYKAHAGGSVGPKEFAALVARSHPAGPTLLPNEVKRLSAWVAESRATASERGLSGCKDGASIRLRGYWWQPDDRASLFFTLKEIHCDRVVVHNPSLAALQLVQWVHSHAGELQDRGWDETVVPWNAAIDAHR
jgi:hypothetical protein